MFAVFFLSFFHTLLINIFSIMRQASTSRTKNKKQKKANQQPAKQLRINMRDIG